MATDVQAVADALAETGGWVRHAPGLVRHRESGLQVALAVDGRDLVAVVHRPGGPSQSGRPLRYATAWHEPGDVAGEISAVVATLV